MKTTERFLKGELFQSCIIGSPSFRPWQEKESKFFFLIFLISGRVICAELFSFHASDDLAQISLFWLVQFHTLKNCFFPIFCTVRALWKPDLYLNHVCHLFTEHSSGNIVDSEKNGSVLSEHIPSSREIEEKWNNAKVLGHTSRENEPERSFSLKPDLNCLLFHKHIKQIFILFQSQRNKKKEFWLLLGLEVKFASFPGDSVVRIHLLMQDTKETRVRSLGQENPMEEEMATHSRK